jgi:predicted RNA-binding Zn ribbon-like protein
MTNIENIENVFPRKEFRFLGERLCLDFANTVGDHATDDPEEYLHHYADLLIWAQQAKILTEAEAEALAGMAVRNWDESVSVFRGALELRETIFRVFSAIAGGGLPQKTDLKLLNGMLDSSPVQLHVEKVGKKFVCEWLTDTTSLDGFLNPIAWSAATLLASDELQRVKQCGNEECGWLFLDSTKNHSRRWCDMADCGSRAKAKRYYRRQHTK